MGIGTVEAVVLPSEAPTSRNGFELSRMCYGIVLGTEKVIETAVMTAGATAGADMVALVAV